MKIRDNPIIRPRGCRQLGLPDAQAVLVVVAHALVPAMMGTDRSRDMRQRIAFQNNAQCLFRIIFQHRLQIGRDILSDGTAVPAWSREAVKERKRPAGLSLRQRFDRLPVQSGCCHTFIQCFHRRGVYAPEGFAAAVRQDFRNLDHPPVSARFQDRRRHGNGPDPCFEKIRHVVDISAA